MGNMRSIEMGIRKVHMGIMGNQMGIQMGIQMGLMGNMSSMGMQSMGNRLMGSMVQQSMDIGLMSNSGSMVNHNI